MGFGRFGFTEMIFILVIALLIFGPSKLPEIGKSLGKALNEFKLGLSQDKEKKEEKEDDN